MKQQGQDHHADTTIVLTTAPAFTFAGLRPASCSAIPSSPGGWRGCGHVDRWSPERQVLYRLSGGFFLVFGVCSRQHWDDRSLVWPGLAWPGRQLRHASAPMGA